jgi:hypothetical protein
MHSQQHRDPAVPYPGVRYPKVIGSWCGDRLDQARIVVLHVADARADRPTDHPVGSEDELAQATGLYFYHQRPRAPNPIAADLGTQEELLAECRRISGIGLD